MTDRDGLALFKDSLSRRRPEPGPPLDAEQLAYAQAAFPKGFSGMLRDFGFGFFAQRRYQFLDPQTFRPITSRLFAGDPQIAEAEVHVTGVDAFGTFTLWSQTHFAMTLDVHRMQLFCIALAPSTPAPFVPAHLRKKLNPALATDPDNRARSLLPFEPEEADFWDVMNRPLFATAQKTFGPLAAGEIYAFVPPLAAQGGAIPRAPLERMVRVSAVDALEAAAAAAPLTLANRVNGHVTEIRRIGAV